LGLGFSQYRRTNRGAVKALPGPAGPYQALPGPAGPCQALKLQPPSKLQDEEAMQLKMETLERACQDLQADLDTARHYIVALMEASAKIGHFSMRTGGGYENVGKAWQGIHRYIAGTQWGKDLGLDTLEQDGFTPMEGSASARTSSRVAITAEESFAPHAASCKLSQRTGS
jgi:hypothetical protein